MRWLSWGFSLESTWALEAILFLNLFHPFFNLPHWHVVLSCLQADDMTVYNDELENRKLIGYCRKEKRKTGLVFLHIIFVRIMLIFPSRVKKNWSQCMGLFTRCSYGKALQHYTCKDSGHGLECHWSLEIFGLTLQLLSAFKKKTLKSMPYIILLMHLVSHNSFIYYMNVFVISYSVMMAVGSCQHTEV